MDSGNIRTIVEEVMERLRESGAVDGVTGGKGAAAVVPPARGSGNGVFENAEAAVEAAHSAYLALSKKGLAGREKIVQIVKRLCRENAEEWGRLELEETRIGRLDHKIEKLLGIPAVPGTEWLSPHGMSGDFGITMEESCPFGVIGAVTPVTHSIPTIACNIVSMVAAGNAAVFNAHPGGARCAVVAIRAFNEAVKREVGIDNIATIVEHPSLESFNAICAHERVNLLCVTGGPGIVKAAMRSGKRSICAGPGNPPVLVDETADLQKAAEAIVLGGGYDNNLLCIGEKEVFVVKSVYRKFLEAFERAGARRLDNAQLDRLRQAAFTMKGDEDGGSHPVVNRDLIGRDASVLAGHAGLAVSPECPMLYAETGADDLFVKEEQMMPMLPVIPVDSVDEGIELAKVAEHGYKHSSMIHSLNVTNMTKMARALESTLFVKNGACIAGLGSGGEGYSSFSIATTTGEGITTPDTFTRKRRCVLVDSLSMM
ncbi:MAG: aldehyde dehydrogenase family protein [Oceanipulchritudo sp.]